MLAHLGLTLLALATSWSEPFELVHRSSDGLTLEVRAQPDTALGEVRVLFHCTASPATLAELAWSTEPLTAEGRWISREVLATEARVRLERQVLDAPLVGRRHSWVRFTRHDAPAGAVAIHYAMVELEEEAVAAPMRALRGSWRFEPDGGGGSIIELRMVSDPGGVLPFLITGAQRGLAISMVRSVVERAEGGR